MCSVNLQFSEIPSALLEIISNMFANKLKPHSGWRYTPYVERIAFLLAYHSDNY